jgi:hypothetical protein
MFHFDMRPVVRVRSRRLLHASAAVVLATGMGSCREVTVPHYSQPSVEGLISTPTVASVQAAIVGMLALHRSQAIGVEGHNMCALGKECYWLTTTGTTRDFITGPMEPSFQLSGLGWGTTYLNVRQGAVILAAVNNVSGFTAEGREGIRGVVKTLMAMELFLQVRIRDTVGIAIDVSADASAAPPPIVPKDEALARIATLLDEARLHLQAAGSSFAPAFTLHSGFTRSGTFNTPATFLQFNRGVKARVEIHRAAWSAALTAIGESFIDLSSGSAATLARGVYHVYGTAELTNGLFDAAPTALYAHPSIVSGGQLRANGQPDLRVTQKTAAGVTRTLHGVLGTHRFTIYASNTAASPMLRNEELILMRAEARYHTGDVAGALSDINFIRVNSGGLAPLAGFANLTAFVDELLYNRTYSLLLERGHRWVDARRYGRLAALPKVNTAIGEQTFPYVMLPQVECDARSPKPQPGCSKVTGM